MLKWYKIVLENGESPLYSIIFSLEGIDFMNNTGSAAQGKESSLLFNYSLAAFVIIVWSITFVSTKTLLRSLTPVEILFVRVLIATVIFYAAKPSLLKFGTLREEASYAAAGLLGTTIYFLGENFALDFGTASNVALLVSTAPMLTGVAAHFLTKNEQLTSRFVLGGLCCLLGVAMIVFNGHFILKLNPLGDLLAIIAALSFALYSVLVRNISGRVDMAKLTGKSFFYALISLLPFCFTPLISWRPEDYLKPEVIANLVFLGAIASAGCYLAWNLVIKRFGAVHANNLIYLTPPLVMLNASFLLHERITSCAALGAALVLAGVYISQTKAANS